MDGFMLLHCTRSRNEQNGISAQLVIACMTVAHDKGPQSMRSDCTEVWSGGCRCLGTDPRKKG